MERYAQEEPWKKLGDEQVGELVHDVASLPTELRDDEEAKRFDLLMLNLQLAALHINTEAGLRRILAQYLVSYHHPRTHLALDKDTPIPRSVAPPGDGDIVAIPEVGGLHHRYERRAA